MREKERFRRARAVGRTMGNSAAASYTAMRGCSMLPARAAKRKHHRLQSRTARPCGGLTQRYQWLYRADLQVPYNLAEGHGAYLASCVVVNSVPACGKSGTYIRVTHGIIACTALKQLATAAWHVTEGAHEASDRLLPPSIAGGGFRNDVGVVHSSSWQAAHQVNNGRQSAGSWHLLAWRGQSAGLWCAGRASYPPPP